MPVITTLGRVRQEDLFEFEDSLDSIRTTCSSIEVSRYHTQSPGFKPVWNKPSIKAWPVISVLSRVKTSSSS